MIKIEQKFLIALRKEWLAKNAGGFWFKIPDAPTSKQVAKPFDAFSVSDRVSIAWEAKQTTKKTFTMKDLRQSQIDGLSRVVANGWIAFVAIYFTDVKKYMIVPFSFLTLHGKVDRDDFEMVDIKI